MTRMWMVDPELLCRQHLLGEHRELHQLVGHIRNGNIVVLDGHAEKQQIETSSIQERHEALVAEMARRGYNHDSPLEYEDELDLGTIDPAENCAELKQRCADCRERITARGC